MKQYFHHLLALFLTVILSLSSYAELPYCTTLRQELKALNKAQHKVKNSDQQNMFSLKKELDRELAKLTFLEGINSVIRDYKKQVIKLQNQFDSNIGNIPELITDAQNIVTARRRVALLNTMLNGEELKITPKTNWLALKQRVQEYKRKHCQSQNALDIISGKEFIPEDAYSANCKMITGFSQSINLLRKTQPNQDQLENVLLQAKKSIKATLAESKFREQQIRDLDAKIAAYKIELDSCIQINMQISKQNGGDANPTGAKICIENKEKKLRKELAKYKGPLRFFKKMVGASTKAYDQKGYFSKQEFQQDLEKQKIEVAEQLMKKKEQELKRELNGVFKLIGDNNDIRAKFSFEQQRAMLCPTASTLTDNKKAYIECIMALNSTTLTQQINDTKHRMQAINDKMINLRNDDEFRHYEMAKQFMLGQLQKGCQGSVKNSLSCKHKRLNTSLGEFVKFGDQMIEVHKVSISEKLYELCDYEEIATVAPSTCQQATKYEGQRRLARNYTIEYDKNGKPIKETKQQRSSTGSIIFAAAADKIIREGLPTYLALDNMKTQNEMLYNQALLQSDMNYLSNQQFDWYMKNYTLYGTNPYALNGGYDPYYMSTFQFGNPNFTLYNGYYSY